MLGSIDGKATSSCNHWAKALMYNIDSKRWRISPLLKTTLKRWSDDSMLYETRALKEIEYTWMLAYIFLGLTIFFKRVVFPKKIYKINY